MKNKKDTQVRRMVRPARIDPISSARAIIACPLIVEHVWCRCE
jgi:hypothetical protein